MVFRTRGLHGLISQATAALLHIGSYNGERRAICSDSRVFSFKVLISLVLKASPTDKEAQDMGRRRCIKV